MAPQQQEYESLPPGKGNTQTGLIAAGGCCCCLVLLVVLYFVLKSVLAGMAVSDFLQINQETVDQFCGDDVTIENLAAKVWTPGCGKDKNMSDLGGCGAPCYSDDLLLEWDALNAKKGGKKVSYPSRKKDGILDVKLEGWWLPGDAKAPRIVIQHGFKSNSNKHRQMLAAHLLRSLGFNVLVNNFRDHCYSGDGLGMYEWGHAYPYDLLGAWDYAVTDPDKILGGAVDSAKVGIMGFSKGAFTTINAFGLEGKVPAAWADGPPFTPEAVFQHGFQKEVNGYMLPFLGPMYGGSSWSSIEQAAADKGIDLDDNIPKDVLPKGPDTKRPFMWVHNKLDQTVPFSEGVNLKELVKTLPGKYDFSEMIFDSTCTTTKNSNDMNHCEDHIMHPKKYSAQLCSFWAGAFGLKEDFCTATGVNATLI